MLGNLKVAFEFGTTVVLSSVVSFYISILVLKLALVKILRIQYGKLSSWFEWPLAHQIAGLWLTLSKSFLLYVPSSFYGNLYNLIHPRVVVIW